MAQLQRKSHWIINASRSIQPTLVRYGIATQLAITLAIQENIIKLTKTKLQRKRSTNLTYKLKTLFVYSPYSPIITIISKIITSIEGGLSFPCRWLGRARVCAADTFSLDLAPEALPSHTQVHTSTPCKRKLYVSYKGIFTREAFVCPLSLLGYSNGSSSYPIPALNPTHPFK